MATIGVNCGHTLKGYGTGAVGKIAEGQHTRLVGNEVMRLLKERGHKVINCTVDHASSTSESLSKVVNMANNIKLDWFVSVHFNAGGGQGIECYTYKGRQYPDALEVCQNIAKLGLKNRGVKEGTGLYVIRKTIAKSMLIEVCFVDSNDADKYLKVGYKAIAKSIVDALVGYVATPAVPKPIPKLDKKAVKEQLYNITCSLNNYASTIKDNSNAINNIKALQGVISYLDSHSNINKQDVIKQVYSVSCSLNSYASKVKNNKCVLDNTRALNGVIDYLNTHN